MIADNRPRRRPWLSAFRQSARSESAADQTSRLTMSVPVGLGATIPPMGPVTGANAQPAGPGRCSRPHIHAKTNPAARAPPVAVIDQGLASQLARNCRVAILVNTGIGGAEDRGFELRFSGVQYPILPRNYAVFARPKSWHTSIPLPLNARRVAPNCATTVPRGGPREPVVHYWLRLSVPDDLRREGPR